MATAHVPFAEKCKLPELNNMLKIHLLMAMRREVLGLYKKIIRLSKTWRSIPYDPKTTETERQYIKEEARTLFHKNKNIDDEELIKMHLQEGETRIELAHHYKIPYPRHVNIPQNVLAPTSASLKKGQKRQIKQSIPVYWKSYDTTDSDKGR